MLNSPSTPGAFGSDSQLPTGGSGPEWAGVSDLSGLGNSPYLISTDWNTSDVSVQPLNSDGTPGTPVTYPTDGAPRRPRSRTSTRTAIRTSSPQNRRQGPHRPVRQRRRDLQRPCELWDWWRRPGRDRRRRPQPGRTRGRDHRQREFEHDQDRAEHDPGPAGSDHHDLVSGRRTDRRPGLRSVHVVLVRYSWVLRR